MKPSRLMKSGLFAAVSGALSAIPVWRSRPLVRGTVIVAPALVAAAGGAVVATQPDLARAPHQPVSPAAAAAIAVGAGVAVAGVIAGSLAVDGAVERALVRRGVRRPRLVIAVAAGALSFALDLVERAAETRPPFPAPTPPEM